MLVLSAPVLAWNAAGHEQVGALADQLLVGTPAAAKVQELLGGLSLASVSVWADCAKGVVSPRAQVFIDEDDLNKYPECTPFDSATERRRLEHFVAANWTQCGTAHDREYCHNQYHYADVPEFENHYQVGFLGTSDHDVVHAINAAIAVLRGQAAPAPFQIADQREALMLLVHYVGDLHQPLHAASIYLDQQGQEVALAAMAGLAAPGETDTAGGNRLLEGTERLHAQWDAIGAALQINGSQQQALLAAAARVPPTPGDPSTWAAQWAGETILVSHRAVFSGLRFSGRIDTPPGVFGRDSHWNVIGLDDAYRTRAESVKFEQLARAGARLAQLLQAIWPVAGEAGAMSAVTAAAPENPAPSSSVGYLSKADLGQIKTWMPAAPRAGSASEAADVDAFKRTRRFLVTSRGQEAANDDVFDPPQIAARFSDAAGLALTASQAPTLLSMIGKLEADANALVAPIKRDVHAGGRVRPFVAYPSQPSCLAPRDLAGHRHEDLDIYHLAATGSYPSTHALMGLLLGLVLSDALASRADSLIARGLDFGESRVICGFHYPSDVVAGRLAAAVLYGKLSTQADFVSDLAALRSELRHALEPP